MAWGRLGYIANGRHRPFRSAPWQILGWVRPLGLGNRIRTQSPSGVRRAGAGQAWSVLARSNNYTDSQNQQLHRFAPRSAQELSAIRRRRNARLLIYV